MQHTLKVTDDNVIYTMDSFSILVICMLEEPDLSEVSKVRNNNKEGISASFLYLSILILYASENIMDRSKVEDWNGNVNILHLLLNSLTHVELITYKHLTLNAI